jgi:RNA:NAD 2'-phosphotransferase (TPT1/KptA family)
MRHFPHRLPAALDHEGFSSVANPVEQLGKAARRFRRRNEAASFDRMGRMGSRLRFRLLSPAKFSVFAGFRNNLII